MLLTKFNPYKELENISKVFNAYPLTYTTKEDNNITTFAPFTNTREGEFAYHIDVDLPGEKKEDIEIDVKENRLKISG